MNAILLVLSMVFFMIATSNTASANSLKEELCKTSAFISAKISPDGQWIAQVGANEFGIANVFIFPTDNPSQKESLSFFETPEIIQFFWAPKSDKVLVLKDDNGKGKLSLHGFDIRSKKHIAYTENFSNANVKMIKAASGKNEVALGLNARNPKFHDLYLLDLDSGNLTLLFENDYYAKFLLSDDLKIILKMQIVDDGSWIISTDENPNFIHLTSDEAFQTEFLSYNCQENAIYFLDNRFSDTNALTKKSLNFPHVEEKLGWQPESDVDEVLFSEGIPKAYATYFTQKKWHILDPSIQANIDLLSEQIGSNFEVISQSEDGKIWIVSNSIPDQGRHFWCYQIDEQKLISLSMRAPYPFSKMYEMVTTSRDGKPLVCYYTLPKEFDKGGYVEKPIPLVVVPHGGPFKVRDRFEFNPLHQWLSSCGYAVMSVNFRLSSGFGKSFVAAGNGQWGGNAHLDVIDATNVCIEKNLTTKDQIAILGASYGGYETLAALTFTPEYFKCCVAICGPSNLKTVLKGCPEFWEFTSKPLSDKLMFFTKKAFVTSIGGDPDRPEDDTHFQKCSPINHLDKIQSPLLLVHGQNDHVVLERESRQIYESMKQNQKSVTYILFPNEGHRFANFSNRLFYMNEAERFLAHHLQGNYSPSLKELLEESTGQVFD